MSKVNLLMLGEDGYLELLATYETIRENNERKLKEVSKEWQEAKAEQRSAFSRRQDTDT